MRAIFLKELKDSRGLLWILIATSVLLAAAPREFSRQWSGLSLFLAVPMLCCYLGARLLAAETEDGQLELLLTVPIPRWKLFAAKFGAALAMTAVVALVAFLGAVVGDAGMANDRRFFGGWICAVFVMCALGAFFSLVCARSQTASFGAFLAFAIGIVTEESALRYFGDRSTSTGGCALMALSFLLATIATGWAFCTTDLTDARERRRGALRAGLQATFAAAVLVGYYLSIAR